MKLYDKVKEILTNQPHTRNDDKKLIWEVMMSKKPYNQSRDYITLDNFLNCPSYESITRARRKIQELHPTLQATKGVKNRRKKIQQQKGTHVFRVHY